MLLLWSVSAYWTRPRITKQVMNAASPLHQASSTAQPGDESRVTGAEAGAGVQVRGVFDTGAEAGGGDQVRGAFDAMTDDAGGGDQVRGAFDEARADELPARTMATAARTGATM